MILLIDNYDSFTYNVYQYLAELGARTRVLRNDAVDVAGVRRLRPEAIVISPGPGTPDESGVTLDILRELGGEVPIFGICLGLQAIGQAFGGRVIRARRPMHGKISRITHRGRGVFHGLPSPFAATRYHSLVVERRTLPTCLEITAETEDGLIMGLRHRKLRIEGVQFHPESVMTEGGHQLLRNFLDSVGGAR